MTHKLDVEGLFWLEGTENKVAGRLSYDMESGPELHLLGSFHPDHPLPDWDLHSHVHGIANGETYTLLNCYRIASSFGITGELSETYSPTLILQGTHILKNQPLEFDSVSLELSHLHSWLGKTLTKRDRQEGGEFRIVVMPPHKESSKVNVGELQFTVGAAHTWVIPSDQPISLKEHASISVIFSESRSLDDIGLISRTLRDLVTIGVDAPSTIIEMTVRKQESSAVSTDIKVYEHDSLASDQKENQVAVSTDIKVYEHDSLASDQMNIEADYL